MRYLYILLLIVLCSCNNQRELQLPEIKDAKFTEVLDVSPAYIFYDETQLDSTLFNRKNLISTTNWLVNVDKRLTLKQVIPHIQYLQNKRQKASMHKNENAKNYFTCNDTSIKNLGFLEFTNVNYVTDIDNYENNDSSIKDDFSFISIGCHRGNAISLDVIYKDKESINKTISLDSLLFDDDFKMNTKNNFSINLLFDYKLSFQEYIKFKQIISNLTKDKSKINNDEFFF
ncbi:MAG: hypothetical protein HKP48_04190 [Winogradskyella sp.]|uniref:hypothetical protein n=1 Tax=Winogradskyella sp. TaxID=1883156 RepID=UPI00183384F1|nr:hypothetical protein [Winogradskyella sp.]MBT8244367.1 hypothetical protein [Winogradskyella sp.]NNK22500.1 hypothetical protein [Winogradskyella sp.]